MTDKHTDEPWGYGWYQDGGKKMAMGYLPTIDYPQSERVTEGPFPLYRAPPASVDRNAVLEEAAIEAVRRAIRDEMNRSGPIASSLVAKAAIRALRTEAPAQVEGGE